MPETEPTSTPIKVRGLSDGLSSLWYPLVAIAVALWFIQIEAPSRRERMATAMMQQVMQRPGQHYAALDVQEALDFADGLAIALDCMPAKKKFPDIVSKPTP